MDAWIRAWSMLIRPANPIEKELVQKIALTASQAVQATIFEVEQTRDGPHRGVSPRNEDHFLRAVKLGMDLERDPSGTVLALRQFAAGCIWLIQRLRALGTGLRRGACSWTAAEFTRLLQLEGLPPDEHASAPIALRLHRLYRLACAGDGQAVRMLRDRLASRIMRLRQTAACLQTGPDRLANESQGRSSAGDANLSGNVDRLRRLAADAWRRHDLALKQLLSIRPDLLQPVAPPRSEPAAPASAPASTSATSPTVPTADALPRGSFQELLAALPSAEVLHSILGACPPRPLATPETTTKDAKPRPERRR